MPDRTALALFGDPYDMPEPAELPEPIIPGRRHPREWVRDIPRDCICGFVWNPLIRAYERERDEINCPWHGKDW